MKMNKWVWIIGGLVVVGGTVATIIYLKKKNASPKLMGEINEKEKPTVSTSNVSSVTPVSKPKINWSKFQRVYAKANIYVPTGDKQLGNMSIKSGTMFAYADKAYNLTHPLNKQILIKKNDNEYVTLSLSRLNDKNNIEIR